MSQHVAENILYICYEVFFFWCHKHSWKLSRRLIVVTLTNVEMLSRTAVTGSDAFSQAVTPPPSPAQLESSYANMINWGNVNTVCKLLHV